MHVRPAPVLKKENPAQVLSSEFCEVLRTRILLKSEKNCF